MFILKPGQFVHINQGRLHAFRKLSWAPLPADDCHSKLRQELILSFSSDSNQSLNESLCISVAWDWTYRGFTSEAINRELSSMMECAALNRHHGAQSLAMLLLNGLAFADFGNVGLRGFVSDFQLCLQDAANAAR